MGKGNGENQLNWPNFVIFSDRLSKAKVNNACASRFHEVVGNAIFDLPLKKRKTGSKRQRFVHLSIC